MRNPSILSATPSSPARSSLRGPSRAGTGGLFDACQIGVVLRAVLLVEAVVAVTTLFVGATPGEWLVLAATVTGGALPATLLWLVAACALKKILARLSRPAQYAAGATLGALSALG